MFTSADKRRYLLKGAYAYIGAAVFCLFFNAVYMRFSYGEYSLYMTLMFLFPLALGAAVSFFITVTRMCPYITRLTENLRAASVATYTVGFMLRGIINISGRETEYDRLYYALGSSLLLAAIILLIREAAKAGEKK